jgi:gas vesicle protein
MKDSEKVFWSVVAGAVAGAITALLLAPKSGKETRRQISDQAGKLGKDVNEQLDKALKQITDFADQTLAKLNKEQQPASKN